MGSFLNFFRQRTVLHVNCMQAPSKPLELASSLAVKNPPFPLAISPCIGESPVCLASSWQEVRDGTGYVAGVQGDREVPLALAGCRKELATSIGELRFQKIFRL